MLIAPAFFRLINEVQHLRFDRKPQLVDDAIFYTLLSLH